MSILKNVSRLFNYNPITLLKNVKAPLYGEQQVCKNFTSALYFYEFVFPGKLVCVQGTVVRAGNIRPLVTRIAFQCLSCHGIQVSPLSSFPSSPPVHTYIRTYLITWYHLKQVFLDANVCCFKCCSQMLEKTNMLYCWCMYIRTYLPRC